MCFDNDWITEIHKKISYIYGEYYKQTVCIFKAYIPKNKTIYYN